MRNVLCHSRSIFTYPLYGRRYASSQRNNPSTAYVKATHTPPSVTPPLQEQVYHQSQAHVLPVYARPQDIVLSHGEGSYIFSVSGLKYLDFSAGIAVNSLGHADKEFLEVLTKQAGELIHSSNVYHNKHAANLAGQLVRLTQSEGGLGWSPLRVAQDSNDEASRGKGAKVFFSNSGTEANEGALKIARMAGKHRWSVRTGHPWNAEQKCDKYRIACFENGFHGRSMGALSVTTNRKYQAPFMPLLPGVDVGRLNDEEALQSLVTEATCAVIVEPIQGEGGVNESQIEWLRKLRERCDDTGAVLIFDEIQCGLYRTGTLWAHSQYPVDCHPDMITMAKPLANGYPIGAVLMRDSVAQYMTAGTHGTTFGGSPLACALGIHVLSRLSHPEFVEGVRATTVHLHERLRKLPEWFPNIVGSQIRGRGLIVGIPFLDTSHPARLVQLARERGVLLLTAGTDAVRLVPSLNVKQEDVDLTVDVIESCLGLI
ncbi:acetylornithine aminotransferase, partial [Ramaria rubella]